MKTTVTGRHVDITTELRELIERKLERLERLMNGIAVDKVNQQAHALKGKWETRRRRADVDAQSDES